MYQFARIISTAGVVGIMLVSVSACPSESEDVDYARQQAALADKDKLGKAVKVSTTLPHGSRVACDSLFTAEKLTEALGEKLPVSVIEQTEMNPDSTATCSIRRGGKPVGAKEQERLLAKNNRLGVQGGDELCNVGLYCAIPADESSLKQSCQSQNQRGNFELGVYACVKVTPKGEFDGYAYKFVDEDTKCVLEVRGGPSVIEESEVQVCARAAARMVVPASLKVMAEGDGDSAAADGAEAATGGQ